MHNLDFIRTFAAEIKTKSILNPPAVPAQKNYETMTTTTTRTITAAQVTAALAAALLLLVTYTAQRTATAYRTARHWLNTRHNFGNEEGDILLTGWQYSGLAILVALVVFALSIKY